MVSRTVFDLRVINKGLTPLTFVIYWVSSFYTGVSKFRLLCAVHGPYCEPGRDPDWSTSSLEVLVMDFKEGYRQPMWGSAWYLPRRLLLTPLRLAREWYSVDSVSLTKFGVSFKWPILDKTGKMSTLLTVCIFNSLYVSVVLNVYHLDPKVIDPVVRYRNWCRVWRKDPIDISPIFRNVKPKKPNKKDFSTNAPSRDPSPKW